jgi:hypothetical protein
MAEETILNETGAEKKKMGTGAKVAIGCGSGCLVVVLLIAAVAIAGTVYVKNMITKYENDLKSQGFETVVSGQMLDVTDPVDEPTLFKAQVVRIMSDCSTDMAVLAQACEISGKIEGKLYFRGQVLTVNPGAEILGGVDAQAQVLMNKGKIEGGITGKYQLVEPSDLSNAPE